MHDQDTKNNNKHTNKPSPFYTALSKMFANPTKTECVSPRSKDDSANTRTSQSARARPREQHPFKQGTSIRTSNSLTKLPTIPTTTDNTKRRNPYSYSAYLQNIAQHTENSSVKRPHAPEPEEIKIGSFKVKDVRNALQKLKKLYLEMQKASLPKNSLSPRDLKDPKKVLLHRKLVEDSPPLNLLKGLMNHTHKALNQTLSFFLEHGEEVLSINEIIECPLEAINNELLHNCSNDYSAVRNYAIKFQGILTSLKEPLVVPTQTEDSELPPVSLVDQLFTFFGQSATTGRGPHRPQSAPSTLGPQPAASPKSDAGTGKTRSYSY